LKNIIIFGFTKTNYMNKFTLSIIFLLSFFNLNAQVNFCASTRPSKDSPNENALLDKEAKMNSILYHYLSNNTNLHGSPFVIPVVFHVVHQNGPENVPDSILLVELDSLNAFFSNSAQYFSPLGINTNIQFCLASVDPYGNPTTGITRDTSRFTVIADAGGDIKLKNVNRWNPHRYLNVWIGKDVSNAYGASAYSSFPSYLDLGIDGIVIQYNSLGFNHTILSHEAGHYLGLYHLFEGFSPCINDNCLLDNDQVCDTPPVLATNFDCTISSCATDLDDTTGFSPFSVDQLDGSNIMTPKNGCLPILTSGQLDRMNASLTQIRFELVESNGCGSNPSTLTPPTASFTHEPVYCYFEGFYSTSTNAEYLEWDFDNDGYFDASGDSVFFKYPTTGMYTIVLRAFNGGGFDTDTITAYINVRPNGLYPIVSQIGINSYGFCKGTPVSFTAAPNMVSYLWTTGDTTQTITFVPDTTFTLGITCVDTLGYTWTRCPNLTVTYNVNEPPAKPLISTLTADSVCGNDSIFVSGFIQPNSTGVYWRINGSYYYLTIPNTTNTPNLTLYPNSGNYAVYLTVRDSITCETNSDTLNLYGDPMVSIPYTPGVYDSTIYGYASGWNNQFYLNGVLIPGATGASYVMTQPGCYSVSTWKLFEDCAVMSDTICYLTTVGLNDELAKQDFAIFPNPSLGIINISKRKHFKTSTEIQVINQLGEIIATKLFDGVANEVSIDLSDHPSGMYFVSVNKIRNKIVKL